MGLHTVRRRKPTAQPRALEVTGERLKRFRRRRKLTQRDLAELAGLKQPLIATIERLHRPDPKWRTVGKLAKALNVSPYHLFPIT